VAILAVQNVRIGRTRDLLGPGRRSRRKNDRGGGVPIVLDKPDWLTARNLSDAAAVADEVSRMAKEIAVLAGAITAEHDTLVDVVPRGVSYATLRRT
jgi:hypothetical protein